MGPGSTKSIAITRFIVIMRLFNWGLLYSVINNPIVFLRCIIICYFKIYNYKISLQFDLLSNEKFYLDFFGIKSVISKNPCMLYIGNIYGLLGSKKWEWNGACWSKKSNFPPFSFSLYLPPKKERKEKALRENWKLSLKRMTLHEYVWPTFLCHFHS